MFPPERRNGQVPFREVTIFWRFGAWESVFSSRAKRSAYRSRNNQSFRRFGKWKTFLPERRIGRVSVREVTIFGRFGAWESIFSSPAKRPAYRSRNNHFFRCFGTWKMFPPERRNGRVPVSEMTIFGRFGDWESVFSSTAKRPTYRSRNYLFFGSFGTWKSFPQRRIVQVPVREVTIFGRSEPEEQYSRLRRNGRLTVREITIFSDVSAPVKRFLPNDERARFLFAKYPFLTFRNLRKNILASGETAVLPFAKCPFFLTFRPKNPNDETAGFPFSKWPFLDV